MPKTSILHSFEETPPFPCEHLQYKLYNYCLELNIIHKHEL